MRISPIQKYALRLLVVSGEITPCAVKWESLDFFKAEQLLSPFGGSMQAISQTQIPQPEKVNQRDEKQKEIKLPRHHRHKNPLEME